MYSSQLDKISSFTMSSPHYIPTPKLVVFLKSSEKDQKSDEEEEEEEKMKKESKLENENSENVRKQTTASVHDHGGNDDGDGDGDDGYHTPTSPCHRIPEVLKCPPAPKRRRSQRSSNELVLGCKEIFYSVMVCEIDEDDIVPKAKKAREEEAIAHDNSNVD